LVDTLQYIPTDHPERGELIRQLNEVSQALVSAQDPNTGLWFQVLDKPDAPGNYLESSAASMFVYALIKGVREGFLPTQYLQAAIKGYHGIVKNFLKEDGPGVLSLTSTVKAAGLGGAPYRDGSYQYYLSEKVVSNDPKGIGAFLMAAVEFENAEKIDLGRGKKVYLDAWFNSQKRINLFGQEDLYHYKWQDMSNSGYSLLGHVFKDAGAITDTLAQAPTAESLKSADVYIIASPDNLQTNPAAHFMTENQAQVIADWVGEGGVLMVFENDPEHADISKMNTLMDRFGIHFNSTLRNTVISRQYEQGAVDIAGGGLVFKQPHHAFMKEICTISTVDQARAEAQKNGETLIATSRYGKGWVFATVDPWLYNEYLDGRRLPSHFDNLETGRELVGWALRSARSRD
jgi:unsaturated rhamnogalacturonyl hydrolase